MVLRLVVVDDHDGFRLLAHELLEGSAFEVVGAAKDRQAAMALARGLRPDLILLDVQLGDGLAFDLVPELVEAGAIVVLTSTRSASDYGRRVAECGAVGFLSKAEISEGAITALVNGVSP